MSWRRIRLRRLVTTDGGAWGTEPEDGEVVAACVRGTDFDFDRLRSAPERAPQRGFTAAEFARRAAVRGDLIIEKSGGGETQPVGRVVLHERDEPVMPTNFTGRLRPRRGVDARFMSYLMASLYADGVTAAAVKQTTGIQNLDMDALLSYQVSIPEPGEQRAIADFLDSETARIDALITKKRRMIDLVSKRVWVKEEREDWCTAPTIPLRHLVDDITVGIVVTPAKWYAGASADGRVPAVRAKDVDPFTIVTDDLVYLTREGHRLHPKSRLSAGDLVVVRTGQAGAAAIVTEELSGANCISNVIVRPSTRLLPEYLEMVLNWPRTQERVAAHSVGAIQRHFGVDAARQIPVPMISLDRQRAAAERFARSRVQHAALIRGLRRQIQLLHERRQVVLAAAVTGELDIRGVAA